jgi:hypothetical protein
MRFAIPPAAQGFRNIDWAEDETILLGLRPVAAMVTLNPELLLETARSRVTRAFTQEECNTYNIDPCPTLEEIRAGI